MPAKIARAGVASVVLALLVALSLAPLGNAQTGSQWFMTDLHVHSVISGDAYTDAGVIGQAARNAGYDAVFVTDHNPASSFEINHLSANHFVFEDTYTRWTPLTYGSLSETANALVNAPVHSGTASLHLKSTSTSRGETFVWGGRGPNFRSGDIIIKVSIYPTRIDPGSGVYVSVSIGGDPTVDHTPYGYTTAAGVVSAGKSTVLVWQLGNARNPSTDPKTRVVVNDLAPYTLNQWNNYTINVSQALAQTFQAYPADQPLDYNGVARLKMAAAANSGTAEAYFDSYSIDASAPLDPADEFAYRNRHLRDYAPAGLQLFAGVELGQTRHVQRFNFASTEPSDFVNYYYGTDGIPLTHSLGYASQINHPGTTVTVDEVAQNNAYGADYIENRQAEYRTAWDRLLTQGYHILGNLTTDTHTQSYGGKPATFIYAPDVGFDSLMRSLYEGRTYSAYGAFTGRLFFAPGAGSSEPYATRYPIFVSEAATSATARLQLTGGLGSSDSIKWIRENATLAQDTPSGPTYDKTRTIPLTGANTYVRTEVWRGTSLQALSQPLMFLDVAGLPADISFHADRVETANGRGYNNEMTKGIAGATWDGTASALNLALHNPAAALVQMTVNTGAARATQRVLLDGAQVPTATSPSAFQAATGSTWYFDAGQHLLYLKARHVATDATLRVEFGAPPAPTSTPTPTSTRTATRTATATATRTATLTPTRTAAPTATRTAAPTVTLTATPTATGTGTATRTSTSTPLPTFTATATPSATPTTPDTWTPEVFDPTEQMRFYFPQVYR